MVGDDGVAVVQPLEADALELRHPGPGARIVFMVAGDEIAAVTAAQLAQGRGVFP